MGKYSLKKELDTTELIKWGSAVIGGLAIFLVITLKDYELKKYEILEKEAVLIEKAGNQLLKGFELMKNYKPSIDVHYTNMLSEKADELHIRVYIKSTSKNDIYIFPPKLTLIDVEGNEIDTNLYKAGDIKSFKGSISPESSFQINYKIFLLNIDTDKIGNVQLDYEVQIDQLASAPIKMYFEEYGSEKEKELFNVLNSKKYIYRERVYAYAGNPIWNDFWENPR